MIVGEGSRFLLVGFDAELSPCPYDWKSMLDLSLSGLNLLDEAGLFSFKVYCILSATNCSTEGLVSFCLLTNLG